jgi:hypothetical protein
MVYRPPRFSFKIGTSGMSLKNLDWREVISLGKPKSMCRSIAEYSIRGLRGHGTTASGRAKRTFG